MMTVTTAAASRRAVWDDSARGESSMTRWPMALAVGVSAAVTSLHGQTQTGASARPPARQTTPLVVMSPKAKSAGWTGVHKPHTRIADVLARHKAQADWAETVVDDESLN